MVEELNGLSGCKHSSNQCCDSANIIARMVENSTKTLKDPPKKENSKPSSSDNAHGISIERYKDETQIEQIMRVITSELSEPYSIYTYRYFIHNWPELCLIARDSSRKADDPSNIVGVIICKIDIVANGYSTGYIAMLAVDVSCRRKGIGTRLVESVIDVMRLQGCNEVVLETEVTNTNAMNLYSRLGFIREKRLFRYYLNGVDAFRLKMFFEPSKEIPSLDSVTIDGKSEENNCAGNCREQQERA